MNKQELVGRLLLEGKITDEEAITLLSQQEQEQPLTLVDPIEVKLDKLLYTQFIDDLFSDDNSGIARLKDIISFMRDTNWKWLGEEVTYDRFKNQVFIYIKEALIQLVEDYRVHNVPKHELHTFCEGGGIRVDCTVNDGDDADCDEDMVNIGVRFIAGDWFSDVKLNDII